jgi:3-hydroxyacyl-CoA dehydrogenase
MFYGEQVGLDRVLERLRELQKTYGDAFAPAPLLEQIVAEGKSYRELGY